MAPGPRSKFGAPYLNLMSFGSKCTVLKEVLVTLLGLFATPAVIRHPGNCAHLITPLRPTLLYKDPYFTYNHVHYGKKKDVFYIGKVYYMNKIYTKLQHSLPSVCEIEINRKNINPSAANLK